MTAAARQPAQVAEISVGQEVAVAGPLDANTVPYVRTALHNILSRGEGDLLVHLADAEVYDAAGLRVIVGIHHRAHRVERRLVLVDVSPRLDRLLRASRLHLVLARGTGEGMSARPQSPTKASPTEAPAPSLLAADAAPAAGETSTRAGDHVGAVAEPVVLFTD